MTISLATHDAKPSRVFPTEGTHGVDAYAYRYTIATLVTDRVQYDAMVSSFCARGFGGDDCEFIYIDNTGPDQMGAYSGLNAALSRSRGQYVVLCHQDVRLVDDTRVDLDARLDELDRLDPKWAIVGNAGGVCAGELAIRISDPHGRDQRRGSFPARVASVDENFVVVRAASRVGFSRDLDGFHLYGADLCLNADVRGYRSYVIDFHLKHLSAGNKDDAFSKSLQAFKDKWNTALRSRMIQTTCTFAWVGGDRVGSNVRQVGEVVVPRWIRFCHRASDLLVERCTQVRAWFLDNGPRVRVWPGQHDG